MKRHRRFGNHISMTFVFVLCVFGTMFLSMLVVSIIMSIMKHFGIIELTNNYRKPFTVFALISLVIGSIMAVFISKKPLKPWYEVQNAANEIANGNYNVRIHLKGNDAVEQMNDSFNHMAEELASVEMLRTDFVNNFSHEFKTPIVSIRGFAKMLKNKELSIEERDEYIDIIINESERLAELSGNVLGLSKIEKQTILTDKKIYNLSEQIRLVIAMLMSKWDKKKYEIEFDNDEVYIEGNEELLKQVWINIIDNSIKFLPENGNVKVCIVHKEKSVDTLITDNGIGISEDIIEHIFDKFFQGDTSHAGKGNGLGLSIAKRIVELHSGTIAVKSAYMQGTTFTVSLPKMIG